MRVGKVQFDGLVWHCRKKMRQLDINEIARLAYNHVQCSFAHHRQ